MLKSYFHKSLIEAGCDEVGRGCLAGPVVAAAVILPKNFVHADLNDSKKLSKKERIQLKNEIIEAAEAWAISEVSTTKIDQVNILNASYLAMHQAVENLSIKPELLLVDGKYFKPYPFIPHQCIIKGDGIYLSIAAASILAKTYRDDLMNTLAKQHPEYGWETNVGYPTKEHRSAIAAYGITSHHRKSFKLLKEPASK